MNQIARISNRKSNPGGGPAPRPGSAEPLQQLAERIGIMYGGKLVEVGTVEDIFRNPQHPYTQLLISSIPSFGTRGDFKGIPGVGLSLLNSPSGCLFHPRCPKAVDACSQREPRLKEVAPAALACVCNCANKGA